MILPLYSCLGGVVFVSDRSSSDRKNSLWTKYFELIVFSASIVRKFALLRNWFIAYSYALLFSNICLFANAVNTKSKVWPRYLMTHFIETSQEYFFLEFGKFQIINLCHIATEASGCVGEDLVLLNLNEFYFVYFRFEFSWSFLGNQFMAIRSHKLISEKAYYF